MLGGAPDKLLDTYDEERRPVAEEMLGLSTRLLEAQKRGSMRCGREVHQLDIGYRNRPIPSSRRPVWNPSCWRSSAGRTAARRGRVSPTPVRSVRRCTLEPDGYETTREIVAPRRTLTSITSEPDTGFQTMAAIYATPMALHLASGCWFGLTVMSVRSSAPTKPVHSKAIWRRPV